MKSTKSSSGAPVSANALDALLAANPKLARAVRDRAGLAEIASLLLQIRSELSLSQKDLAARAGISKTMISELENSANDGVTLRTLVRIIRAVGGKLNLAVDLGASEPGCVSTTLNTGRYTGMRVAFRRAERGLSELAA